MPFFNLTFLKVFISVIRLSMTMRMKVSWEDNFSSQSGWSDTSACAVLSHFAISKRNYVYDEYNPHQ